MEIADPEVQSPPPKAGLCRTIVSNPEDWGAAPASAGAAGIVKQDANTCLQALRASARSGDFRSPQASSLKQDVRACLLTALQVLLVSQKGRLAHARGKQRTHTLWLVAGRHIARNAASSPRSAVYPAPLKSVREACCDPAAANAGDELLPCTDSSIVGRQKQVKLEA